MLVIRFEQMAALAGSTAERRRAEQERWLARDAEAEGRADAQAYAKRTVASAWILGLTGDEEVREFARLALTHGDDWATNPEKRWMTDALADKGTSSARDRLRRLQSIAEHRESVAEANQSAVEQFSGGEAE